MSAIPESIEYHIGSIPPSVLMSWLSWLIVAGLSFAAARSAQTVPTRLQTVFETLLDAITGMADDTLGKPESRRYYPLLIGLFVYILFSNLMGLIPGLISPTADLNLTAAMAIIVFLYYNYLGFQRKGIHYLLHFFGPPLPWYFFPIRLLIFFIEMVGNFARPFSLALRLFCNIFSKELLLGLLAFLLIKFFFGQTLVEKLLDIAPFLLRPIIILLGLFMSVIQALIFLLLSVSYIAGAIIAEEHDH